MTSEWLITTSTPQYFTIVESHPLCCAYFTAPWCFRCKQVWEKIGTFPVDLSKVKFLKVDLEEIEELGELLNIATLPTFVLVKDGAEVHRVEGVPQQRPARKLAQAIRQHLLEEAAAEGQQEE